MARGPKNGAWKGGRTVMRAGYVLIRAPWHPACDVRGYVYEHRLVAEWKLGRRLRAEEVVHHLNGDKGDNRPANLRVYASIGAHNRAHARERRRRAA